MTQQLETWAAQLAALARQRDQLADLLQSASRRLSDEGERPPAQLVSDLLDYRQQFQSMAVELQLLDEGPIDGPVPDLSLDDLDRRLDWQRRVHDALRTLGQVATLRRADETAGDTLAIVREDVDILRQRLTSFPDVDPQLVNELAHETHPLCDLLRLAGRWNELGDDDWYVAMENVRDVYGKHVATAAARGRLCSDEAPGAS